MSEQRDSNQGTSGTKVLAAWLGFFLLVFTVAGLAFYFGDDTPPTNPTATAQKPK
jgi:hypothetical protein